MRQFIVVAKVAIQLGLAGSISISRKKKLSLNRIGSEEFGLTIHQIRIGVARAQHMLYEIEASNSRLLYLPPLKVAA